MVKISDIAKDMGFSDATVSNALTGRGRMKQETRDAINKRAAELGYILVKRSKKRAGKNIIIIAENLEIPFVVKITEGITREAFAHKIMIPIYNLGIPKNDPLENPGVQKLNRKVDDILQSISHPLSGIIYVTQYARVLDGLMLDGKIPAIFAFCTRNDGLPYVHYDDKQGAYLAVESLIQGGCRNIAMISGPINSIGMIQRTNGYQRALIDNGLSFDPSLMRVGDWSKISGYQLCSLLLKENKKIDSIFAQNDNMAIGAIQAITDNGLRIPEDISVIGFDNSYIGNLSVPPLSSVDPLFDEMGKTAFNMMMTMLSKKNTTIENMITACTLIHRNTTKPVS